MKTSNRRDFLKKAALAGASALVAPGLLATEEKEVISFSSSPGGETDKFSYISKFHIIISCKLIVYIVMCFYQETN